MRRMSTKTPNIVFYSLCFWSSLVVSLSTDSEILIQVKNGQLNDLNGELNDWVMSSANQSHCNWTGITCDANNNNVIYIDLSSLNISGGFPSNFCHIPTLQTLSLSDNYFNGMITSQSLLICSHLWVLNLSNNLFIGQLPDLWGFNSLKVLDLSYNNFSGKFSASFGRLPSLNVLNLVYNSLNGSIPWFLTNLTDLTRLELAYNPFKPSPLPRDIGNLTKLESLFMAETNLIGEIPYSIGNLVTLTNLDVSANYLTRKIPDSISRLKSINTIKLYDNQLLGEILEGIVNLSSLIIFDASRNSLTGILTEKVAAMQLECLYLNDNFLSGGVPESLVYNQKLNRLKLFNNSFRGKLPQNLGKFSPLKVFDVSLNSFTGEFPPYLCQQKELWEIIASKNQFSGNFPEIYGDCTTLNGIIIYDNNFSGEVPSSIWGLPNILSIYLSNNKFKGPISPSISSARLIIHLLLSGNNFSSSLTSEICKLRDLEYINFSSNQFSGELPSCITQLKKLQKVNMQENLLSGEIPSSVSLWNNLIELNLSTNQFSGSIPPQFGDLPMLMYLDLSRNFFTGQISPELTKLNHIELNFSYNKLSGKVPAAFEYDLYSLSFLGNPKLCSPTLKPLSQCSRSRPMTMYIISILVCFGLVLAGFVYWIIRSRATSTPEQESPYTIIPFQNIGFNVEDIFPHLIEENLIGSGGSSQVYKVSLRSGQTVAVKKLWNRPETQSVYRSEIQTLGRIRHRNIVTLLVCCSGEDFWILVYEYMENGSLGHALHGEGSRDSLHWPQRLNVAVGVAQGLAYLHDDCVPPIMHRDVKSDNILLDQDMRPRVADFGLAKILQQEVRGDAGASALSNVVGSFGYIAPEYGYTINVTEKSDVYSFGVMLFELIMGKRPNDCSFGEDKDIVRWIKEVALSPFEEGTSNQGRHWKDLSKIIDARMNPSTYSYEEVKKVLNVALWCTSTIPVNRPSMRMVVRLLKGQH